MGMSTNDIYLEGSPDEIQFQTDSRVTMSLNLDWTCKPSSWASHLAALWVLSCFAAAAFKALVATGSVESCSESTESLAAFRSGYICSGIHCLRVKSPSERRRDASRTRWSEEEAIDASRDSLALSLRFGRWGKFITNGWNSTESVVDLAGP